MIERFDIAGYARISVDEELDRDNVSIENQKSIIEDFVTTHFPNSTLTFFEDRDRSGYTFEQREGYQEMRRGLMSHKYDILIVKDFSRFSRRNSRGLVELEDLRDAGVRIISIGDNIDFPNDDDWLKIQFQFLINEMHRFLCTVSSFTFFFHSFCHRYKWHCPDFLPFFLTLLLHVHVIFIGEYMQFPDFTFCRSFFRPLLYTSKPQDAVPYALSAYFSACYDLRTVLI